MLTPRRGAALIGALALVAMLGSAASAQAATRPSASPHAAGFGCSILTDEHHGTPLWGFVPGNGNNNLYFDNSGTKTQFCEASISNGTYQIFVGTSGMCLAVNASNATIYAATAAACANDDTWTEWSPRTTTSASYIELASWYFVLQGKIEVIYDDTQRPATYAAYNPSNQFEWMGFPPLNF